MRYPRIATMSPMPRMGEAHELDAALLLLAGPGSTFMTGQSVIVIQPANPQVVYVPVYNTQTVYVQAAPPPSSASVAGAAERPLRALMEGTLLTAAKSSSAACVVKMSL